MLNCEELTNHEGWIVSKGLIQIKVEPKEEIAQTHPEVERTPDRNSKNNAGDDDLPDMPDSPVTGSSYHSRSPITPEDTKPTEEPVAEPAVVSSQSSYPELIRPSRWAYDAISFQKKS